MDFNVAFFIKALLAGFSAVPRSLLIAFAAMAAGFLLGLPVALIRFYRIAFIGKVLEILVTMLRAVPVIVFYFVSYVVLSGLTVLPVTIIAIVALSIPATVCMSEVFRGGLESVHKNQFDAAYSIGHPGSAVFFRIVLPQVIPVVLPLAGNISIQMLKSVPVSSLIGVQDILNTALMEATINYRYLESYFAAGLIFWGIFIVIERIFLFIETHYKNLLQRSVP